MESPGASGWVPERVSALLPLKCDVLYICTGNVLHWDFNKHRRLLQGPYQGSLKYSWEIYGRGNSALTCQGRMSPSLGAARRGKGRWQTFGISPSWLVNKGRGIKGNGWAKMVSFKV